MGAKEEAKKYHEAGFNCAQSVFAANISSFDIDEKTALAVSGGFGGGLRYGEECGCISGGIMAVGLASPYIEAADMSMRRKIGTLAHDFNAAFEEKFGCVRCSELKAKGCSCNELVEYAAELAEKIIKENK